MTGNKLDVLIHNLKDMESALLAFSGGADSTFLLKAMQLSGMKSLAVTATSETMPGNDLLNAETMAKGLGIEHRIIKTAELEREEFVSNTPERCFFCKDERFGKMKEISLAEGYNFVLDGTNCDDLSDYRPGREAAKKHLVRSPFMEAGFSKKEIRDFSKQLCLPTWDTPASPCLATRIPYGRRITKDALLRIERAENFLRSLGFCAVRVRDHGAVARIEIGENEIALFLIPEKRALVSERFKTFGYTFIALDLDGFQSGSMNRGLDAGNG
jgi:pyridinium-3,5-biscarboxylic acid mononucleotide sulfurtransferase